ncbi:MAG: DUF2231 domain-containing protein [Gaiellaceae bacterium]|jgi:uncharacterized membrane protein|nr:DUF2231 domain-containing protein [Acidobacteriota bacterium]
MKLSYLWRGLPGHPIHPPLTDATIGAYTFATVAALIQVIGITSHSGAYAWWLALVAGAIFSTVTVTTGFLDWLTIESGTPLKRTANAHALANATASVFFILAIIIGHKHYTHGLVGTGPFILTVIGFCFLTLGGWLGGAITYVHGMRVLNLLTEPARKASAPIATPEKKEAEGA